MAMVVTETRFRPNRNLSIAPGKEIVPNTKVELMCYQANRRDVSGGAQSVVT